jgi:hypothetical protein
MKPIISPVPGALVFLCADGVYTEAPLYVGPFDCGFVRNPRGEGYLRLHYVGETSVPGVTYSGVWGAVLAKAKLGSGTVVTPVEGKPAPQVDYPQADWSKDTPCDVAHLRSHIFRIGALASRCAARADMQPSDVLAALNTIDDASFGVRGLCTHIIGSYQKGE